MKKSYAKVCIIQSTAVHLFQQDEGTTSDKIEIKYYTSVATMTIPLSSA
jgi:hypothetical protein